MKACIVLVLSAGGCGGCDEPRTESGRDAADVPADVLDGKPDAPADAPPDSPDAPPDAYVAYPPECTTAPATLRDVSPRVIGDLALSGNVLYISAYEQANTGDISNSVILSIDLTTANEAYAPVTTAGFALLVAVGQDVFASITDSGTILRLHPGVAPETLITGRPSAGAITADATHVYWSEQATPGDPAVVKRRLLAGGTVESVLTCDRAYQLFVVGTDLYCVPLTGSVLHVAKDGSGQVAAITTNGYPIISTIHDGADLYSVGFTVYPQLDRIPLPDGPLALMYEGPTLGQRYAGLAATSTHFYVTEQNVGVRRFRRTNLATSVIATDYVSTGDPIIWNNRLYYATASATDTQHWLRYCVD
jgi:hypothetical protein